MINNVFLLNEYDEPYIKNKMIQHHLEKEKKIRQVQYEVHSEAKLNKVNGTQMCHYVMVSLFCSFVRSYETTLDFAFFVLE